MSDYRRYFVSGGTYFFTVVTFDRRKLFADEMARKCLREAIQKIREQRPFEMPAVVLLPDHLHCLWTLPRGDFDYSTRWRRIKAEFTTSYLTAGGSEGRKTASRVARMERSVWQRRFWEHTVNDEHDFERHFDYIHFNPVKHGLVNCPADWPHSTFHRYVKLGVYDLEWGCASRGELNFMDVARTTQEPP